MTVTKRANRIAIIGGGASGAITLDSLIQEGFTDVTLFERRDKLGGVWVLDEKPDKIVVPPGVSEFELDPALAVPDFEKETKKKRNHQQRYLHTPSYENLRTNIPEQLMTYSDDKTWGDVEKIEEHYVRGSAIQAYIERYLLRHGDKIKYNSTVEEVTKDYENNEFELVIREEIKGEEEDKWTKQRFDAVVIATGHYHVPFIPDVPGIKDVWRHKPELISHSKTFRATDKFDDEVVLVIGTRASGADIVDIAKDTAKDVYNSKRSNVGVRWSDAKNIHSKPIVERYEVKGDDVIVHFGDGTTLINPDKVIYATGYRYSYPFLRKQYPGFSTGYVLPDLYQHTFYIKDPLLSVVGVPTDAISFRAFEYQAVFVSRYLAGLVDLPPVEEQFRWALERWRNKGDSRAYHTIDVGGKLEYLELLTELGGGVKAKGSGRDFPQFTEDDLELHKAIAEKLHKFFSEAEDDGVVVANILAPIKA